MCLNDGILAKCLEEVLEPQHESLLVSAYCRSASILLSQERAAVFLGFVASLTAFNFAIDLHGPEAQGLNAIGEWPWLKDWEEQRER